MLNNKEYYLKLALKVSDIASSKSALKAIDTNIEIIKEENGLSFECRSINSTNFKFKLDYGPQVNPFKPWNKDLEISSVGNDHMLILNKYPVQIGHMLLISKKSKAGIQR